jgi:uncharacterized membrane protein YfbV (UPF0208 family)
MVVESERTWPTLDLLEAVVTEAVVTEAVVMEAVAIRVMVMEAVFTVTIEQILRNSNRSGHSTLANISRGPSFDW